jgi:hypothetical protein
MQTSPTDHRVYSSGSNHVVGNLGLYQNCICYFLRLSDMATGAVCRVLQAWKHVEDHSQTFGAGFVSTIIVHSLGH